MKDLRAFFIPTAGSSVSWWRIQNFVEAAWRTGAASFKNELWVKDLPGMQPWQALITDGEKYDPLFIRQFVPMIDSGCAQADAVVFQYGHEEGALELFDSIKTRFPQLPLLLEIDDNVLSVPDYNEAFDAFDVGSEVRRRVISMMRSADALIVSTPYLADIYTEFNPHIYVVPNCIDFKMWDKLKGKPKKGIRIGWAGGSGHEGDFAPVADSLKRVLDAHKDATLVLVNGPAKTGLPEFFKGVERIEHHATWVPVLKYPKMLKELDLQIMIAPVVDSAFNRGKSNLKWLEGSALGIPTVAMNVGHYAQTINSGVDGYLCDEPDDFELALHVLINDKKKRKAMGLAANARVRRDFNVDTIVHDYVRILEEVAEKKAAGDLARSGEIVEATA